jgi:hypothetical protein
MIVSVFEIFASGKERSFAESVIWAPAKRPIPQVFVRWLCLGPARSLALVRDVSGGYLSVLFICSR